MNTLTTEQRHELLDRLQTIAMLQTWLWKEATTIADELLDCELDSVLDQTPELALACGPGGELTYEDLDDFIDYCRRIVTVCAIRIDLSQPGGATTSSS